jgi:light-regulated signal transduction histidine kinase (bacteriophytochrome)
MAAPPLARDRQSLELYLRSQEAAEARRQLQKAKAEITATNRDLENFSYSISHDLRAPLRAIDGFSRLLGERMQGRMDAEDQRLLAVIRSSSKTMGQLIDDLLHYSRVNRAQLRLARVDMKALIERLWPGVANGFSGTLQIGELPWATCDAALIGLVWENLLENAVKFTGKTPDPQIKISGETDDLGSVYHIRDNGAGFDMRFLDKLFNVFQRLHNASEFPGTGIGLAIVSRIILHHGGRVWAEGVPGKGACFHFTLPDPEKSAEGGTPHATR